MTPRSNDPTSIARTLQDLRKILSLEQKQDYQNRAVVGGVDHYVVERVRELEGDESDVFFACHSTHDHFSERKLMAWREKVRAEFSQYLTLSRPERARLVEWVLRESNEWILRVSKGSETTDPNRLPDELLAPLIPKDKARAFQLTHLKTLRDLEHFTPKWALHRGLFTPINHCVPGVDDPYILARINGVSEIKRGRHTLLKAVLADESGYLTWIWFNRPYLKKEMMNGRRVVLHASPEITRWGKQVVGQAGTYEFLTDSDVVLLDSGKVVVMYPSTPTLTQAFWKGLFAGSLSRLTVASEDPLGNKPPGGLYSRAEAIEKIHRPDSLEDFESARKRLAFDELLALQLFLIFKRRHVEARNKKRIYRFGGERVLSFRKSIPFTLTSAQRRVLGEIREDLQKPFPMNRLLQGDVGSGKTLVAAIAFLYAADSGVQCALMAPTEILAQQHLNTLKKLLEPAGLKAVLLTGDLKAAERREVLKALADGTAHVGVGTHALLEKDVQFKNLGLVVIDERHKFGVLQRATLEAKGAWPDSLMMTATPFPRALVLTEYGDTDLSVLDEMPKGRKPVKTAWKRESQREEVYQFIRERVLKGEQAYLVYPVVEESKTFLKSAVQMYHHFQQETFHGFKVGLLHGKMKKDEKQAVMNAYQTRGLQILVSTTVVEVGVDVSNATVIVVEHAERFGLAQLHQLRGRVGRGDAQAYCFLITSGLVGEDAVARVKALVSTTDGFKISELDLKLRGPGEIFGLAQSGFREGGVVDLKRDLPLLEDARAHALAVLKKDPDLERPEQRLLRELLEQRTLGSVELAKIS